MKGKERLGNSQVREMHLKPCGSPGLDSEQRSVSSGKTDELQFKSML